MVDLAAGTGRIAEGGHRFVASSPDVERAAQWPALVSISTSTGTDRARRSMRTSRRGDHDRSIMASAASRAPDIRIKGPGSGDPFERPVVDRDVHPEKVTAAWAQHVAAAMCLGPSHSARRRWTCTRAPATDYRRRPRKRSTRSMALHRHGRSTRWRSSATPTQERSG